MITSESSNDDDESPAPAERTATRTHEGINQAKLGELLFGHGKAEIVQKPAGHYFEREKPEAQHSQLFAAIAETAAAATVEHKAENNEDDDDEEEGSSEAQHTDTAAESAENATDNESAPTDRLSEAEKRVVVKAELAEHQADLAAERQTVEQHSADDVALAAVEKFNRELEERLNNPDASVEESAEEAAAETVAEARAVISAEDTPDEEPESGDKAVTPPDAVPAPGPEAVDDEPEDDGAAPAAGGAGGSSTPPPPSNSGGATGGAAAGGGGMPPSWSVSNVRNVVASRGWSNIGPAGSGYNTAPVATGPSQEDLLTAERRGQIRGLVAGGIVGYLLGRRKGRLKTEAKLLPVQKKLEQEVKELHTMVSGKEDDIRRLTRRQAEAADLAARQRAIEQLRPAAKIAQVQETVFASPAQPAEAVPAPFTPEQRQSATSAASAGERPVTVPVPELFRAPEPTSAEAPPAQHIKHVERMTQQELLVASEKVIIEGASLRAMYESHQITEPGLRHILTEFMSGGDIKKALTQELAVKQTAYERDPYLRDRLSAGYAQGGGAGAASAAGAVPSQMPIAQGQAGMQPAIGQSAVPDQSVIPDQAVRSARRLETMIISGWIVLIIILVITAALLLARR